MANFLADAYRNSVLGKTSDYSARVDLDTDNIYATFIDEGTDTPATSDVFVSGITAGALVPVFASAVQLDTITLGTVGAGVFDAANTLFSALSGASVEGILVFKKVTTAADSPFLWYYNTGITGVPFTPSGGDVTVQWAAGGLMSI